MLLGLVLVLFIIARIIGGRGPGSHRSLQARAARTEGSRMTRPNTIELIDTQRVDVGHRSRVGRGSTTENVSAWFGDHKVLDRVTLEMQAEPGHRAHRSVGLRQVDVPADPQPHARARAERVARRARSRIDGIDIYRSELLVTDIRRRIGMVFQKPNPFPAMTVAENVVAGLKLARRTLDRARGTQQTVRDAASSAPGCGTR